MAEHRPGDRVVAAPPEGLRPAKGWTKASLAMAHALATTELVQYALGRRREVTGHLLSWRVDTALRTRTAAPRFPVCPHCCPTRPVQFGRASCGVMVWQYVLIQGASVTLKKNI